MNKILIIEDDQLVANIYRNKFSVENFQVEIALDGITGLQTINTFQPDVVILDLMMPDITGLEVLKKIRAQPEFQQLPVIVFSNTYLSNMVQEAWKSGATKCLSKSNCTPKQVIEMVKTLLNRTPSAGETGAPSSQSMEAAASAKDSAAAEADAAFQDELRQSFINSLPGALSTMRALMQGLSKNPDEAYRVKQLQELYRKVHAITCNAGIAGMLQIAQMADALEALLKELHEKPKGINASTLRTVALAVDFLGVLFDRAQQPDALKFHEPTQAKVLVVDDEAISRRAVTYALEKGKLQAVSLEDPIAALQLLARESFDLIFLDVDMPGMNGFELCTKLRALPGHKKTPVVFVTSLTDFESRANSTISGGNDLIAKPFLFIELTVKALLYVLRGQLQTAK
ncbi:MAG: Response regulator receiver protein [Pedosphaera sp.]|nr:Response regulator receiver protein [Pedosphaera sp.]